MAFDAFLSYSHAGDGRLAPALQRAMQRLAKPWYRARALRVFRDESALSANPHLWSSIQDALDESDWFVLLASPEAAASEWVDRELRHWLATKRADRILAAVTDGTWQWDNREHRLLGTAVPTAIREVFSDEPRHVDLRWARVDTDLDLRSSRFRDVAAQLAAPVHGIAKDDLESEDVRLHRHARRLARGAGTVLVLLVVLSLSLGAFAWQQRGQARSAAATARREADAVRRDDAKVRRAADAVKRAADAVIARSLAADSLAALHAGRNDLALLLAVEAERARSDVTSAGTLVSALVDQPMLDRQLHGLSKTTTPLGFSPDGRFFAATGDHVRIWDLRSGQPLAHEPVTSNGQFADSGRLFVGTSTAGIAVWDLATGRVIQHLPTVGATWATAAAASVLASDASDGTLDVWNLRTGVRLASIATGLPSSGLGWSAWPGLAPGIALSADGTTVALASTALTAGNSVVHVQAWNVATGSALGSGCTDTSAGPTLFEPTLLSVEVLPDDRTVRTVRSDRNNETGALFGQCDAGSGRLTLRPSNLGLTESIAGVSPDEHTIAVRDGATIQLVRAVDGAAVGRPVRAPYGGWMVPMSGTVTFSPDGRYFAASEFGGDVRIWRTAPQTRLEGSTDLGSDVAQTLSSNAGEMAVTNGGDVVDLTTTKTVTHFANFTPINAATSLPLSVAAISTDGRTVAALTANALTVFDRQTNRSRTEQVRISCSRGVDALGISQRLAIVGCLSEGVIQTIDLSTSPWQTGAPVTIGPWPTGLTFSSDGRALAVTGDVGCCGGLQLVDIAGTQLKPEAPILDRGVSGSFTPDSRAYVLARGNGEIDRLAVGSRNGASTVVALPGAGAQGVLGVSRDGRILATAGTGTGIGLWDLQARQLVANIPVPDLSILGAQANFELSALVIDGYLPSSNRRRLDRFEFSPAAWEQDACTIADRNLTQSEWTQFLPGVPYHKTCPALP